MKTARGMAVCTALAICWLFGTPTAMAYRPFSSTDAAVADTGKSEVELGADFMNDHGQNTIAAPSLRYNYGFAPRWEATLEGSLQVYDSASRNDLQLLASQFDFKGVLLEGPLQNGPHACSLGVELTALLPETLGHSGLGFEGVLLGGFRAGDFTLHLNAGGGVQRRTLQPLAIWGIIAEHPLNRSLRLAMEVNGEAVCGASADNSALLALLWEHSGITYDIGVRHSLTRAATNTAFTLGLTFSF
jgi:hypothetical protein